MRPLSFLQESDSEDEQAAVPAEQTTASCAGSSSSHAVLAATAEAPTDIVAYEAGEEWMVEAILEQRAGVAGEIEYLVKWQQWTEEHNTWEPEANLGGCVELLSAFHASASAATSASAGATQPSRKRVRSQGGGMGAIARHTYPAAASAPAAAATAATSPATAEFQQLLQAQFQQLSGPSEPTFPVGGACEDGRAAASARPLQPPESAPLGLAPLELCDVEPEAVVGRRILVWYHAARAPQGSRPASASQQLQQQQQQQQLKQQQFQQKQLQPQQLQQQQFQQQQLQGGGADFRFIH